MCAPSHNVACIAQLGRDLPSDAVTVLKNPKSFASLRLFRQGRGSFCPSARSEAQENCQPTAHTSPARITSRSAPACSGRALRTGAALPGHQQQRNHSNSLTFRTCPGSRRNLRDLACYAESQRAGTAAQIVERASVKALLVVVHNYVRHRNFLGHKRKQFHPFGESTTSGINAGEPHQTARSL